MMYTDVGLYSSFTARFQNVAYLAAVQGGGDVQWQCCNCCKDFPVQPMSQKEYDETACWQCKNRPKDVLFRMRQETASKTLPPHLKHQQDLERCMRCAIQ
jgi:hypothetical protein